VVEAYTDAGVSDAKDRKQRPGLDRMLSDASRRKFDVVMAWAIDRVGGSLIDLVGTRQHLEACGVDLHLDQRKIGTTTLMGKLILQITGAFAEFERSMTRRRILVVWCEPGRHRGRNPAIARKRPRHRGVDAGDGRRPWDDSKDQGGARRTQMKELPGLAEGCW
jgi:DNA invertase Pin-like site-specific DNA recombinase